MKITFCDQNYLFDNDDNIAAQKGSILDLDCDAVVSPANSFGFMDGGIDYAYSAFFGWDLQARLQREIQQHPFGELLVGQAIAVPTGHNKIKTLISAPTMRVPKLITDAADIFMACRAATRTAKSVLVRHLAFPGMGTGCGGVPFDVAQKAMKAGVKAGLIENDNHKRYSSWREAQAEHFQMSFGV